MGLVPQPGGEVAAERRPDRRSTARGGMPARSRPIRQMAELVRFRPRGRGPGAVADLPAEPAGARVQAIAQPGGAEVLQVLDAGGQGLAHRRGLHRRGIGGERERRQRRADRRRGGCGRRRRPAGDPVRRAAVAIGRDALGHGGIGGRRGQQLGRRGEDAPRVGPMKRDLCVCKRFRMTQEGCKLLSFLLRG